MKHITATLLALLLSTSALSASTESNVHKVLDAVNKSARCMMIDDWIWHGEDPESGTSIRTILKFEVDADYYNQKGGAKYTSFMEQLKDDPRVIKHFEILQLQKSFTDEEEEYYNYKFEKMVNAHEKELKELWEMGGPHKLHYEYMVCILTSFGIKK